MKDPHDTATADALECLHVMPSDDLREHVMSRACWCNPEDDEGVIIHSALDGREDFEAGKRLPS